MAESITTPNFLMYYANTTLQNMGMYELSSYTAI